MEHCGEHCGLDLRYSRMQASQMTTRADEMTTPSFDDRLGRARWVLRVHRWTTVITTAATGVVLVAFAFHGSALRRLILLPAWWLYGEQRGGRGCRPSIGPFASLPRWPSSG